MKERSGSLKLLYWKAVSWARGRRVGEVSDWQMMVKGMNFAALPKLKI